MPSTPTVLLIDDDESLRRVTEYMLREDGYSVIAAANGREGLELFRSHAVDVVLTDVLMPEMDGMELLPRLKATAGPSCHHADGPRHD